MESSQPVAVTNQFDDELLIRMDNSLREHPSDNTCRPVEPPLTAQGTQFEPFDVPFRPPEVQQLPNTPLALFEAFVPSDLVEKWVQWTNTEPFTRSQASTKWSRRLTWTPTTTSEVYIWLAALIYMGIHRERRLEDHWKTQGLCTSRPSHAIGRFITFNRFSQLFRVIRLCDPKTVISSDYDRANEWSNHIQRVSLSLYQPGSLIAVDECMIRYTGRSKETTKVPNKPIPVGYKVWVVAQRGYFLSWIWHLPKKAMGPVAGPIRRKRPGEIYLNPTQSVVPALTSLLPEQPYHVFLDNLFSSLSLFKALRQRGIGATGTARLNCGISKTLTQHKAADSKGQLDWPWGTLKSIPTPDNLINQLAWKDNALVLILSTVYTGEEVKQRIRRRPNSLTKPQQKAIKREFADQPIKQLPVPTVIAEYNDHMGGVDVGDQLRSYLGFDHPMRRGGWKAIAYGFLLDTVLINTYLLQKRGQPQWPAFQSQVSWRQQLIDELVEKYATQGTSRQRYRSGNDTLPISEHNWARRGSCSRCAACQGFQLGQLRSRSQWHRRQRAPLSTLDDDGLNRRRKVPQSRFGCNTCNVALCRAGDCWYKYHSVI
ncbi:hypothetical protein HIM_10596 [Hirsutella minnesotensis 3608]|uniref:PiggyBac transposable element-derived protein domain-containing protein n=1 Tax=Hirsutella minnesotensis 3608 TaxID=1043627 RepID=A0A0F7ZJW4_9HYPO|nr:hypothetical protein HIM_10596 [Hirsutella minnesotensis 3608]